MNRLICRRLLIWMPLAMLCWCVAPVSAGTLTLAWDANSETNIAGYRLYYGTQVGSHPTMVDVGKSTTWQLRSLTDAQKYYFVVTAYNTAGLESLPSPEISGSVVGLVSLTSNISTPAPTGKAITWTALAGAGTLEYRFVRYSQSANAWTEVQPYGSSNSFTWTPALGEEGTHIIQVWARTQGSTMAYEAWRTSGFFTIANTPVKIGSIETDVALPAPAGTPITWKAKAVGGPAPLQYRFLSYKQGVGWSQLQDYSTNDSYTWTPTAEGTYVIQVWVRGNGSSATYDGWRSTDYFDIKNGPAVATLSTSTNFPAGSGTPITWKGAAALGPGPLEYKFALCSSCTTTPTWTVVQNYGPSNTCTWTPATTGTYVLQVMVRRVGSTASYDAWGTTGYFQISNSSPVITGLSSDPGLPLGTGESVTWRVKATGGPGPLQYKFLLYNDAKDTWTLLRDYAAGDTVAWTPSSGDAGNYVLQVWVRRPSSTAAYDTWSSTGYFTLGDTMPVIQAFMSDVGQSVTVGTPVTWTTKASGGPGPLEYYFARLNNTTQAWTVAQSYGWDNTFAWVPLPGDQGSYTFQVWVRRAGSTAAWEAWTNSQVFQVN